jgi:hypothetical protein
LAGGRWIKLFVEIEIGCERQFSIIALPIDHASHFYCTRFFELYKKDRRHRSISLSIFKLLTTIRSCLFESLHNCSLNLTSDRLMMMVLSCRRGIDRNNSLEHHVIVADSRNDHWTIIQIEFFFSSAFFISQKLIFHPAREKDDDGRHTNRLRKLKICENVGMKGEIFHFVIWGLFVNWVILKIFLRDIILFFY